MSDSAKGATDASGDSALTGDPPLSQLACRDTRCTEFADCLQCISPVHGMGVCQPEVSRNPLWVPFGPCLACLVRFGGN